MQLPKKLQKVILIIAAAFLFFLVTLSIYYGSIPEKYQLRSGDASPYDIVAPRSIADPVQTTLKAEKAATEVADVMLKSEHIVKQNLENRDQLLDLYTNVRLKYNQALAAYELENSNSDLQDSQVANNNDTEEGEQEITSENETAPNLQEYADLLIKEVNEVFKTVVLTEDAVSILLMEDSRFTSVTGHISSLTSLIMSLPLDNAALRLEINQRIQALSTSMSFYKEDAGLVERSLGLFLKPNVVYDSVATANARQAAYERVMSNPVMIEKGTRLLLQDEIVTDEIYELLEELDLIDSGSFDYKHFAGISLLLIIVLIIAMFYLQKYEPDIIYNFGDRISLILIMLIPLLISVYVVRSYPLTPPVYFAAVLLAAYFGFRTSILMTVLLVIAILPMTDFNPLFPLVAISGSITAALLTKGITRRDNYALIIIMTAGTNLAITLAYGLLQKERWSLISINAGFSAISGMLSVIAAIGIMPLFEMMFNTVSPLRLVELSQPGQPLLRRLFVEAPGSSQHSMMVANLADAAANAIGANSLLARVGAYYHDIGKLENPAMFTENQQGENPHDYLSPKQSADVILNHPEQGVRIGRRYRLPAPILKIIHEHHGSSSLVYFYHKAKEIAEEQQLEPPNPLDFKYKCPTPSSKESAIIMLSDSIEAAVKSTGITRLDEVEKLIRKIIKDKNEQDQLIYSELSFRDVEKIIGAYLQVYAGHFHERVKYPEDRVIQQPTK